MIFRIVLIVMVAFWAKSSYGQKGSLSVKIDKDTMYQDEVIKVEFLLDNITGNFKAPDFEGFRIVSGPNTSSSYSIINGEVNQKKSFTFMLMPLSSGSHQIGSSLLQNNGESIQTDPVDIFVWSTENLKSKNLPKERMYKYESDNKDVNTTPKKRVLKKI